MQQPRLILLNGAPASGKSTLAARYAERHPLTLALELDVLRAMLGGWLNEPVEAGVLTRSMALEAARVHLTCGRDVIIPQYLGRLDYALELERLGHETGAQFIEIMLVTDPHDAAARFERRSANAEHPAHLSAAALLAKSGGIAELCAIHDRLAELLAARPATILIESVDGQIEATYTALVAAISAVPDRHVKATSGDDSPGEGPATRR